MTCNFYYYKVNLKINLIYPCELGSSSLNEDGEKRGMGVRGTKYTECVGSFAEVSHKEFVV